ncbi:MAG: GNAT family N-acetyltransferase [Pseudomonadota bacterium]
MKIIRAEKKHFKEIIRLVTDLISELVGKRVEIDELEAKEFIQRSSDNGKYFAFLALDSNQNALGVITVGESGAVYAGGEFGVIHEFYIAPEMRSNGLGNQLIETAKNTAIDMGWKRLEVGAPPYPDWVRTKNFYLKEGFVEIGPRLKWIAEQIV